MFGPLFRKTMICGCIALLNIAAGPIVILSIFLAAEYDTMLFCIPMAIMLFWAAFGIPLAGGFVQLRFPPNPNDPRSIRLTRYIASHEWF